MFRWQGARLQWPLLTLLSAASVIRVFGLDFGLPALNDPDELMFQMGAVRMLSGLTLNPGWFGHPGTTTIYLLALIDTCVFAFGWVVGWFSNPQEFVRLIYSDPSWVILPGRVAMVLFSVFSIFLTYRLASRLFNRRVGLAASALLSVNPVHVFWSQVIRTDIMAICFMLLCMLSALQIVRSGRFRHTVLASGWLALAVATKWPFAIAGLAILGAAILRINAHPAEWSKEVQRTVMVGGLSIAFLALVSPFLLLDYDTVLRNLQGEAQTHHLGATGGSFLFNGAWYLCGPILSGLGFLGAIMAMAGSAGIIRNHEAAAILAPTTVCFLIVICAQNLVWERWALPLMPIFAISAGLALVRLHDILKLRLPSSPASLWLFPLVAVCLQPATTTMLTALERTDDTRQRASDWARAHISEGNTVLVEHFAFDLLSEPWRFLFPLGNLGCVDVEMLLNDKVQYDTIDAARGGLSNVDYGTMSRTARNTCPADYAILTQYDRYRAERETYPHEVEAYEALLARGRIVATFVPEKNDIGGPIVRIVSFRSEHTGTSSSTR